MSVEYRLGARRKPVRGLGGKVALIVIGIMLGAAIGLYVGLMTLPLPETTVIYSLK